MIGAALQRMHYGMAAGHPMTNGGGSSSSSSSSTTTETNNYDKRQVVETGMAISTDSSTVNVQAMDAGVALKALDTVMAADATAGEGFTKLLTLAGNLFEAGGKLIDKTADTSMAAVEAVNTARNDAAGAVDQKTLVILGAATVAGIWAWKNKG